MKKRDIMLIIVIIAAAVLMYVFMSVNRSSPGSSVRVTVDGELYGEYDLNKDQTIEIKTGLGSNVLIIENGSAYMQEADCPDGYCIDQGKISRNTETIVCLPHKVVAEVISEAAEDGSQVDMIAR